MTTRDVFQSELDNRGVVQDGNVAAKGVLILPETPADITGVQAAGPVKDLLTALAALGLITDSTTAE